jgi:capsular polysaccharide transport system permease protein
MASSFTYPMTGTRTARPVYLVDHILIIRALILRSLRLKHGHRPMGFFSEFIRPAIMDISHYYIFYYMGKGMPAGIKVEEWVWTAFAVWFTFTGIWLPIRGSRAAPSVPFPGVSAMHVRLAICIWPVIINTVFLYGSIALMIFFGDNIQFPNVFLMAMIMTITATLALGFGLVIGALVRAVELIEPFVHILPWFLLMGSGIYASISAVPSYLAAIVVWCPVIHLTEYSRYAIYPGYPIYLVNLWYPALCAVGVLFLGLLVAKRVP